MPFLLCCGSMYWHCTKYWKLFFLNSDFSLCVKLGVGSGSGSGSAKRRKVRSGPTSRQCRSTAMLFWRVMFACWSKIAIYLSLGLHKGRTSYRRSLQSSKENIQHFKTWKFFTFFYFCGSFLPSWIRIRIRNLNVDLDPDPASQINADPCGSGSSTLLKRVRYGTSSTSKHKNSLLFSTFVGHFCLSGSGSSNSD